MHILIRSFIVLMSLILVGTGTALAQQSNGQVMFVLDGSGSMWGQVNGKHKITIAKEVMTDLIRNWDADTHMGLTVYGHRRKGDCDDIEIMNQPGPVDRKKLIAQVNNINPRGKTPIHGSLSVAAQNMGVLHGKETNIVLVSDGLETCEKDPCALAKAFKHVNAKFTIHVVGFDVTQKEFEVLQCMATETDGKFFRANNANELKDALAKTVAEVQASPANPVPSKDPEPSFFLYAKLCETCDRIPADKVNWNVFKDDKQHYLGLGVIYPNDPEFEPGTYAVGARYLSSPLTGSGEITVGEDGKQIGALNLNGGNAKIHAFATDNKAIAAEPIYYEFFPIKDGKVGKKIADSASSNSDVWLPAGKYQVTVSHQTIKDSAEIEIIAGKETKYEFDLRIGHVQPDVVLFEGGKIQRDNMFYRLRETGSGVEKATGLGPQNTAMAAKPGLYNLQVDFRTPFFLGGATLEFPVEVKAGETIKGPFNLNVGRFEYEITSKSGKKIDNLWLNPIKEDGSLAKNIGSSLYSKLHGYAPAGKYTLLIQVEGERTHIEPFDIVPGEVRQLKVELP